MRDEDALDGRASRAVSHSSRFFGRAGTVKPGMLAVVELYVSTLNCVAVRDRKRVKEDSRTRTANSTMNE